MYCLITQLRLFRWVKRIFYETVLLISADKLTSRIPTCRQYCIWFISLHRCSLGRSKLKLQQCSKSLDHPILFQQSLFHKYFSSSNKLIVYGICNAELSITQQLLSFALQRLIGMYLLHRSEVLSHEIRCVEQYHQLIWTPKMIQCFDSIYQVHWHVKKLLVPWSPWLCDMSQTVDIYKPSHSMVNAVAEIDVLQTWWRVGIFYI